MRRIFGTVTLAAVAFMALAEASIAGLSYWDGPGYGQDVYTGELGLPQYDGKGVEIQGDAPRGYPGTGGNEKEYVSGTDEYIVFEVMSDVAIIYGKLHVRVTEPSVGEERYVMAEDDNYDGSGYRYTYRLHVSDASHAQLPPTTEIQYYFYNYVTAEYLPPEAGESGWRKKYLDAPNFFVVENQPPEVTILLPHDGDVYPSGEAISFSGYGVDPEDGNLESGALSWNSSIDGDLGVGATLSLDNLSPGVHTITLTGVDSGDLEGEDQVEITIEECKLSVMMMDSPPTAIPGERYEVSVAIENSCPDEIYLDQADLAYRNTDLGIDAATPLWTGWPIPLSPGYESTFSNMGLTVPPNAPLVDWECRLVIRLEGEEVAASTPWTVTTIVP